MYIPCIEDLLLVHPSRYRRGCVPLHMIYQPIKQSVCYFVMPESWSIMMLYDVCFDQFYYPNIYVSLMAKSNRYRKGKVEVWDVLARPHIFYEPEPIINKLNSYTEVQQNIKRFYHFSHKLTTSQT